LFITNNRLKYLKLYSQIGLMDISYIPLG